MRPALLNPLFAPVSALPGVGPKLKEGMVLAIEPMLVGGGSDKVHQLDDGWTIVTSDGSLAAHIEHTVLVGANGPEVLTQQ